MVKFLALGPYSSLKSIQSKFREEQVDLQIANFEDIFMYIDSNKVNITIKGYDITDFDFVWMKTTWSRKAVAYSIAKYLDFKKISYSTVEYEASKLLDSVILALKNIYIPETIFLPTERITEHIDKIEKLIGYPLVIKPTKGLKGNDVVLVNTKKEFMRVITSLKIRTNYLIQKYIPNDFDYRIIISNNKIASAIIRKRTGDDFRNNTALGAEETFLNIDELNDELKTTSIEASKALDLQWSGIDLILSKDDQKSYVIEVNRSPGLTINSPEIDAGLKHILDVIENNHLVSDF